MHAHLRFRSLWALSGGCGRGGCPREEKRLSGRGTPTRKDCDWVKAGREGTAESAARKGTETFLPWSRTARPADPLVAFLAWPLPAAAPLDNVFRTCINPLVSHVEKSQVRLSRPRFALFAQHLSFPLLPSIHFIYLCFLSPLLAREGMPASLSFRNPSSPSVCRLVISVAGPRLTRLGQLQLILPAPPMTDHAALRLLAAGYQCVLLYYQKTPYQTPPRDPPPAPARIDIRLSFFYSTGPKPHLFLSIIPNKPPLPRPLLASPVPSASLSSLPPPADSPNLPSTPPSPIH